MTPATGALPDGFVVRLADDVDLRDDATLVGGSPRMLRRLSPAARGLLHEGRIVVEGPVSRELVGVLLRGNAVVPVIEAPVVLDDVTVVIPVRDRTGELDALLPRLSGLRVVVVDDGSNDPAAVAEVVGRYGASLVVLAVNQGPAAARNAGLARVETAYVAFVDSDVEVGADTLARLRAHFADPSLAAVGPRVRGVSTGRAAWQQYDVCQSSLDLGPRSSAVSPGFPVSYLPTACLMARVDALGAGFDEAMRVGEDVDLLWRLTAAGHRVRYDAELVVGHRTPATLSDWLCRKVGYGTSAALLAERHGDAVAPAVLTPLPLVALAAASSARWWSAPVATTCAAVTYARLRTALNDPGFAFEEVLRGYVGAGIQCTHLLLRHWWPLTLAACAVSRRARGATTVALVLDAAMELPTRPRARGPGDVVARRLDDAAYGTGVWLGAWRGRSARCLLPRVRR